MEVWVKSKRIIVEEGSGSDEDDDGATNCHWRAAFRARSAKNRLGTGLANSAEETLPSGSSCTRTLIRTLPRMVERALSETTGRTLRWMVGAAGFTFDGARVTSTAEVGAAAGADGLGDSAFAEG